MSPEKLVRPEILALTAYQVPEAQGMVKLDAMETPYPLPPALRRELADALSRVDLNRYPEATGRRVRELLARRMNLPAGMELLLGNGSDDLLQMITLAVARPGTTMMYPAPSFVMYGVNAALCGMKAVAAPLREDFSFDAGAFIARMKSERPALVFIAYPNNPTGVLYPEEDVLRVIRAAEGLLVLDEAYHVLAGRTSMQRPAARPCLGVPRTLSKLGLAGLRLGDLAGPPRRPEQGHRVRRAGVEGARGEARRPKPPPQPGGEAPPPLASLPSSPPPCRAPRTWLRTAPGNGTAWRRPPRSPRRT